MPVVTYVRGPDQPGSRVFLAIPCREGITAPCFASVFEAAPVLAAAGIRVDLCLEAGNCHVDDARNSLVREFLKTDCTDLVFIDDDVGFRAEDLLKLVSVDRDVVAGVYPKKQDPADFPVFAEGPLQADAEGLVEVVGAPTGFMRIRRAVLEKLSSQSVSFIGQAGDPTPYHVIFERMIDGGRRWSGDYAFCRKWRKAGGSIHVDPEMVFSHTGAKTWSGSLGDWWKDKHGVTAALKREAFDEAVSRLKAGNPTAEDFLALHEGWGNPWAASPELLATLWASASGDILECGCGLSTLVLATRGRVTALEHDPVWASYTSAALERHGLTADIRCKPLADGWYGFTGGTFDTVVVDGPPRTLSDRKAVLSRVSAPLWVWDDFDGLDGFDAEITTTPEGKVFAVARPKEPA